MNSKDSIITTANKEWVEIIKKKEEEYYKEHQDSLIPLFELELKSEGFQFEIGSQALGFMPKHKKIILPIAIKYYCLAKNYHKDNEQNFFMSFFRFKGIDEVVPMLLDDYYYEGTPDLSKWYIADCLFQIRAKSYIDDYIEIASNKDFGSNRKMIVLLLGKLKSEIAIPTLISLLEDDEVRLQAIDALGQYRREEFRCNFERFLKTTDRGCRKYAKIALNKLDKK